ncbi:MAG: hypothetical protein H0X30_03570 [Anaerolineae bacterium]|nr:hypothetical protein [Anaerolineae bacterium]
MGESLNVNQMELITTNTTSVGFISESPAFSRTAWYLISLATVVTFLAFMLLDPQPNIILAISSAANVSILMWATYKLYLWGLLLSPMAAAIIGPGWIIYYSWGNLGARIAGPTRFGSNYGSLDFFPRASLLTTIGLFLFSILVFGIFQKHTRKCRIRYQDLTWKPWQAITSVIVAIIPVLYLSFKYPYIAGYFYDVTGILDQSLNAFRWSFIILAIVINVSVMLRSKVFYAYWIGSVGLVVMLLLALVLRSRTFTLLALLQVGLCWITLQPYRLRSILVVGTLVASIFFLFGTVVKLLTNSRTETSIIENILTLSDLDINFIADTNRDSAEIDVQYRTAGLEYPAALLMIQNIGLEPMYGRGMYQGIMQGVPDFLRPKGVFSERQAISNYYTPYGLIYNDSIGVPLTSGIADWGELFSWLIYAVIAAYCLIMWKVMQFSPRLFIAFLIVGIGPSIASGGIGDLFWETSSSVFIKGMGFSWLLLFVFGFFFMPTWSPEART